MWPSPVWPQVPRPLQHPVIQSCTRQSVKRCALATGGAASAAAAGTEAPAGRGHACRSGPLLQSLGTQSASRTCQPRREKGKEAKAGKDSPRWALQLCLSCPLSTHQVYSSPSRVSSAVWSPPQEICGQQESRALAVPEAQESGRALPKQTGRASGPPCCLHAATESCLLPSACRAPAALPLM